MFWYLLLIGAMLVALITILLYPDGRTFQEKFLCWFNKSNAFRLIVFGEDKRYKIYYRSLNKDGKTFDIDNRSYLIEKDFIIYSAGMPTLFYNMLDSVHPNYKAINAISLDDKDDLIKEKHVAKNSKTLNAIVHTKLVDDTLRNQTGGKPDITLLLGFLVVLVALAVGFYLVITRLESKEVVENAYNLMKGVL